MTKIREYVNQKKLDNKYNKSYLTAMYNLLINKDNKKKQIIFDPLSNKEIEIERTNDFLHYWLLYFNTLNPILKEKYKMTNQERYKLIHLIFGNSFHRIRISWFNFPTLMIDVGQTYLKEQLDIHKEYIKEKQNYDIH